MSRPSARDRILDAAERLIAEDGLAGTSLRAINQAAGLSAAALHYHFGNKRTLVEAILVRRMDGLMQRRTELLDALSAKPGPLAATDVVSALVLPMAELIAREGAAGQRYVRFLARTFEDRELDFEFVQTRFAAGVERLEPLLQRALPELPPELVRLRLSLALDAILRALADRSTLRGVSMRDRSLVDPVVFSTALIDFIAGGLAAESRLDPRHVTAFHASDRPGDTA